MTNTNMSVGRSISIVFATLVIALTLSPFTTQAADLSYGEPEYFDDQYVDFYDDQYVDYYDDQYVDFYDDQDYYSYDSGCYSCGGGSFGGGSFGGGGFIGGGSVGQPSVKVSNVNNNYNNNQNQNINNVSVNVGSDDDDDDKEDKKKKKKRRDDDYVVYHPPVYHNPTPYVTLSQTPYTGLELGFWGTIAYWGFVIFWCLVAAYLIAVKKVHQRIAARLKVFLFGDDSVVTHPAYAEIPVAAVASASAAPQMATLGEKFSKSDLAELATMLVDVIEGKSTRSYSSPVETPATDTTDPFILSQINRTR